MAVNLDKPSRWKADIALSVDMYNQWFLRFAPDAFRNTRIRTTADVEAALACTGNLTRVHPDVIRSNPQILPTLRMSTCPPLAVDRLIGLAGVPPNLVRSLETRRALPARMAPCHQMSGLRRIADVIAQLADRDIFVWLGRENPPTELEIHRAATIVADRLCGSVANPIIRNAQEQRQLAVLASWLEDRGYRSAQPDERTGFERMTPGTYGLRVPVTARIGVSTSLVTIPVDAVVVPLASSTQPEPIFIEAKSAGDFTNVNKRRKEEATKAAQLRETYGTRVRFVLFLCGYFDTGYLGYGAAEGIDWVWEHRLDDLAEFGL